MIWHALLKPIYMWLYGNRRLERIEAEWRLRNDRAAWQRQMDRHDHDR